MAVIAAVNFVLLGFGFLSFLGLTVSVVSFFPVLGHLFGIEFFQNMGIFNIISFLAAVNFFLLGIGLLCLTPDYKPLLLFASRSLGGRMIRQLLIPTLIVLIVAGWIRVQGQHAALYERRLAEEKKVLERVNLELDNFVYIASHDLRAPLRAVSAFARFVSDDYRDKLDQKGKRYLDDIQKYCRRMSELIVQSPLPSIYCDPIKIVEVFVNLIQNAIKYTSKEQKPRVQIGCHQNSDHYQFFIRDNGIGIDPKYHEKIFEMFKRLHRPEEFEGTGAGLYIVRRVVEEHGGRIWLESSPGKGSVFYFTVPKLCPLPLNPSAAESKARL